MNYKYSELETIRRNKLLGLIKLGIKPYESVKPGEDDSNSLQKKYQELSKETLIEKNKTSSLVGRIMTFRGPFIVLKDKFGVFQIYVKKNNEKLKQIIKLLDIGDIIWFSGILMKTNTDQVCLNANDIKIVAKSLKPWPEKWHGLTDIEERMRHRYLDLAINDEVKHVFWTRTKIIQAVRQYFDNLNYMEVETPILHRVLGGASARPFTTHHNTLKLNFYLRIATELPLKRLLVGGIERVYEIGRLFRNEGIDTTHNPEFTTIEFYEAYSNLEGMINRTEELFSFIAQKLNLKQVFYQNQLINLTRPFKRIDMVQAISEATGSDFLTITLSEAQKVAKKHHVKLEPYFTIGHIINGLFENLIEKTLINPTFVTNYPIEISPLAAPNIDDPRFTDRAELFIGAREYANMFTELNDPIDQLNRFQKQLNERDQGNDEANEIDYDFVEALEYGMPSAGGCGIGIDRLVMFFTNKASIREVLLFPHLRDVSSIDNVLEDNEDKNV